MREPWKHVKTNKESGGRAATCLYVALNVLYKNAVLLYPVMPEKVGQILEMLGQKCPKNIFNADLIHSGTTLGTGKSPFPRIDVN